MTNVAKVFGTQIWDEDLGPLKYFLGFSVSRMKDGIFLSQRKYAHDLLYKNRMSTCHPVDM